MIGVSKGVFSHFQHVLHEFTFREIDQYSSRTKNVLLCVIDLGGRIVFQLNLFMYRITASAYVHSIYSSKKKMISYEWTIMISLVVFVTNAKSYSDQVVKSGHRLTFITIHFHATATSGYGCMIEVASGFEYVLVILSF